MSETERSVGSADATARATDAAAVEETRADSGLAGLAGHLLSVPGVRGWALWRTAGLRSAGFPARSVLALASRECAEAADSLLDAEEAEEELRSIASQAVRGALGAAGVDGELRRMLRRVLRHVSTGKPVPEAEAAEFPSETAAALSAWGAALGRAERARAEFSERFAEGAGRVSGALRELAREDRFREAIVWQNRQALHGSLGALLRPGAEAGRRGSEQRRREELVAGYAQRYFVKNDTIGFFGPVGWARLDPEGEAGLTMSPGRRLLAARGVYFEGWCVDALAEVVAREPGMRPWLVARRSPLMAIEGRSLLLPGGRRLALDPAQAAVLDACDGTRNATEVVEAAAASGGATHGAARASLEAFERGGLVSLGFALPFEARPERRLRGWLEKVEDADVRARALGALGEFERWRESAEEARDDAAALDHALAGLDTVFEHATGGSAKREEGKTYAGRTLVYCDARRDVEVVVGRALLEELGGTLGLLLESGRWLTQQVARIYGAAFRRVFELLTSKSGARAVGALTFWAQAQPVIFGPVGQAVEALAKDFERRWQRLLSLPEGARRVHYGSEELRPRVESEFGGARSGWRLARYHSPDVMIVAEGVEAVARGDFKLVLGEFHLSTNTLRASFFVNQHPRLEELFDAVAHDLPGVGASPVPPKSWPKLTSRTFNVLTPRGDYKIEVAPDSLSDGDPARTLRIADLVVEDSPRGLQIRTRDGSLSFDILDVFADLVTSQAINYMRIVAHAPHTPRVEIDRVVVARETWRVPTTELGFAALASEHERFAGARRLARRLGMPRHIFVKSPKEVKPFFVDFESPALVGLLGRAARALGEAEGLTFSEMLPGLGELWLEDAAGERYTSEFRLVAVDISS